MTECGDKYGCRFHATQVAMTAAQTAVAVRLSCKTHTGEHRSVLRPGAERDYWQHYMTETLLKARTLERKRDRKRIRR